MSDAPANLTDDARAAQGIVTESRRCIRCSYDIRGLPTDGVCPECGTMVADSLRDNLLINSSPEYLAKIHRGVFLVQTAIILSLAGFMALIAGAVLTSALTGGTGPGVPGTAAAVSTPMLLWTIGTGILTVITSAMGLYGWWLFSEPDPRASPTDRGEKPRRIIRTVVIIEAVIAGIVAGVSVSNQAVLWGGTTNLALMVLSMAASVSAYVCFAVRYFASMLYVRWLAPRVPNARAQTRARRMMWLGPLLAIVGMPCLYLGPLIALVLYYNLLEWLRKDIKTIRAVLSSRPGSPPA